MIRNLSILHATGLSLIGVPLILAVWCVSHPAVVRRMARKSGKPQPVARILDSSEDLYGDD